MFRTGQHTLRYRSNHEQTVARIAKHQQWVASTISATAAVNAPLTGKEQLNTTELNDSSGIARYLTDKEENVGENFEPMRITFLSSTIRVNDQFTCRTLGQRIMVGYPSSTRDVCSDDNTYDCWETCTSDMLVTEDKLQYVTQYLIPKLRSVFEERIQLRTRRLTNDIDFPSNDPCESNVLIPKQQMKEGIVANREDLVVLLTMRPERGLLGYAYHCATEPNYDRPVIGLLNLNPEAIASGLGSMSSVEETVIHELIHLLGFSDELYGQWYDSSMGKPRVGVTDTVTKTFVDSAGKHVARTLTRLVTPKLIEQAKLHFGCDIIDGVVLEDTGGQGTVGSHFKATTFMNEIMTGSDAFLSFADQAIISQFTYALLEDTGWYKVAWETVHPLLWGKNSGCSLMNERCEDWKLPDNDGYYCSKTKVNHCNFEHTAISTCDIKTFAKPLSYYEHLPNSMQGGTLEEFDHCPFAVKYEKRDCRDASVLNPVTSLEIFGSQSACFGSNTQTLDKDQDARCYRFSCDRTMKMLLIHLGAQVVSCPSDQTYLRINNPGNLGGYVDCPHNGYDMLCGSNAVRRELELPEDREETPGATSFFCRTFAIFCVSAVSAAHTINTTYALSLSTLLATCMIIIIIQLN